MNNRKCLATLLVSIALTFALLNIATAQSQNEMETFFSKDYAGVSIIVNASKEILPGENLTLSLWVNCTSAGVKIDYLNFSVYGFRSGQEKMLLNSTCALVDAPMSLNETMEQVYDIFVPGDVWDATYCELCLKYAIIDELLERNAGFPMTNIKNAYVEELEQQFRSLNETYQQLNNSYWALQQNYTSLQGSLGELESTRTAVIALAATSLFFVATTVYLIMRKPKQTW